MYICIHINLYLLCRARSSPRDLSGRDIYNENHNNNTHDHNDNDKRHININTTVIHITMKIIS